MFEDISNKLDAATARLVTRLSATYEAEVRRMREAARPMPQTRTPKRVRSQSEVPSPTQSEETPPSRRVPLSQRANVFRMPSGAPLPPRAEFAAGPADAGGVPQHD